ncbi:MAG: hypothetical protein NTX51_19690 [Verrucomicrobia bacterium]|nr:hypothetical protein [Verrucomicrobiota bacterium]
MEIHDTTRTPFTKPPGPISTTESADDGGMDAEVRLDFTRLPWEPLSQYCSDEAENYFRRVGATDDPVLYRVININLVGAPGGEYCDFTLEKFILGTAYDVTTRQRVNVRRRVVQHAPSGEPILPISTCACCEFVSLYEPAGWMTLDGWGNLTRIFHKRSVLSWCRTFFPEIQLRRDLLPPLLGYETAFAHLVK